MGRRAARAAIIAGVTLTAILASAEPQAETASAEDLLHQMQDSFANTADELFSSLVYVEGVIWREGGAVAASGSGSGFIIDHDADDDIFYVATNYHVSGGPLAGPHVGSPWDYIQVTTRDGRTFEAVQAGGDPRYDVALIAFGYSTDEIFDWSPSIAGIGDSDVVQAGDLVYAVGGPQGMPETLTLGIISHVSRDVSRTFPERVGVYIQTDVAINPGNSGGPLVSLRDGTVIGINTWQVQPLVAGTPLPAQGDVGIGFAVPINTAMRIIDNLKSYGTPRHGYIGVEFSPRGATDVWAAECGSVEDSDLDMDDATLELIVSSLPTIMNVTPLAPADRHGLKPGDVIFLVDGELASAVGDIDRPPSHSEAVRMIDALTPGADSTFEVIRDCEFIEITLQPGVREDEEPADRAIASWPGMLLHADLTVAAVSESGVAASLGIVEGDVILYVDGTRMERLGQFYQSIDTCREGPCSLGVARENGIVFWTPDFLVVS